VAGSASRRHGGAGAGRRARPPCPQHSGSPASAGPWGHGTAAAAGRARGDLWVLAAVLSWAAYTILLARRPAGVEPLPLLTVLVAIGVLWIAPFYALELWRGARLQLDAVSASAILYVALFASLAAYAVWNAGVAAIGASHAGVFLHLMPAFGSILAALALGESFRAFHPAGIALILAGVTLAGALRPGLARRA
jgi:drug/metabolite transporter (DMT)-like permease